MSDENNVESDDAPDIPPALTPSEWQFAEIHRSNRLDGPAIRITPDNTLRIGGPGMPIEIRDANDIAALIALANEQLRRFDDPRAILREHIALLRYVVNRCATDLIDGSDRDYAAEVHEFADALESYLPPAHQ